MSTIKPIRFPADLAAALEARAAANGSTFSDVVRAACAAAVGVADETPARGQTTQTAEERADAGRAGGIAKAKAARRKKRAVRKKKR
jgi:hypothetical protein